MVTTQGTRNRSIPAYALVQVDGKYYYCKQYKINEQPTPYYKSMAGGERDHMKVIVDKANEHEERVTASNVIATER